MATATGAGVLDAKTSKAGRVGVLVFGIALIVGFIYAGSHLFGDLQGLHPESALPFILLGIALLTALGFEFVNGFHDTANAVATVIYTHSLEPHVAVVWSGAWNFIGVLVSSGAVAFGDRFAAAGGTDSSGGQQRGIRHGVRAADRGDHLESGNVVLRTARVELAHAGRFDHRRGHRQSADVGKDGDQRRGLGPGDEHRQVASALAAGRICGRGAAAAAVQGADSQQGALRSSRREPSRRRSGFALCWS